MSQNQRPMAVNFAIGGLSGCASCACVHPFDVIRVQMQLNKATPSFFNTVTNITSQKGYAGLYTGLSAGLVRQLTYGLTKFGVYNTVSAKIKVDGKPLSFVSKLGCGLLAGTCAALIGNPAEVALVRMTADSQSPENQRRNYKNVFDAMIRVSREEGVPTLWRGIIPHIYRAAFLSAAQLATFAQAKESLMATFPTTFPAPGIALTFTASLFSGLACTIASCPMDVLKTRIQNMQTIEGVPEYSGAMDCFSKTVKAEGPMALFKGFGAFYVKLAPYTTIVFVVMSQLQGVYDAR